MKISESETSHSSLITSPKNFKKFGTDLKEGKITITNQVKNQNQRLRDLQKGYRKQNNL